MDKETDGQRGIQIYRRRDWGTKTERQKYRQRDGGQRQKYRQRECETVRESGRKQSVCLTK
jgi:hypothetical protein